MKRALQLIASIGALSLMLGVTLHLSSADPLQVTPLPPVETSDGRAGTCYSYYPGDPNRPYLPLVHHAGSRWDRFDFIWPNIELSANSWHFDGYDDLVTDMNHAGMNVVGILLWTPGWLVPHGLQEQAPSRPVERPSGWFASSILSPQAPPGASAAPPPGLYQEWNDWTTSDGDPINYWGRYVYKVVARYSDPTRFDKPVTHWEVWNEVDDGAWDYFWTGSKAEYAQLLKVAYQATKAACPDCTVLYAGLLYWAEQHHFEDVLDILNDDENGAASNYYFDVMSVHLYSRSSSTYDTVNHIRSRMNEYVPDHPIWLTETGVPVWDDDAVDPHPDPYPFSATQEEAAAYVIQSYANALASGVERYFFFRANDQDMGEYFGLMRNDRTFRPSYLAYQVATSHLISPTMVTSWTYSRDGVRRVTLWGTPRGKISVLWNVRPEQTTFNYGATLPSATLVDPLGASQTISPTGSAYALDLPGATAKVEADESGEADYYIGGEPYLVIEEDTVPPSVATVDPLPPTTYSSTIPVSWNASDDQAGTWGFEVQVQRNGDEDWVGWLRLADTVGITSTGYEAGVNGMRYCFRARAWDRAGNKGPWSSTERCTQVDLGRAVDMTVGMVFGDKDGDEHWNEDAGEPAFESVSFRLVDGDGLEIVEPSVGSSWQLTRRLWSGKYVLVIEPESWPSAPPGWLPRHLEIEVPPGETTLERVYPVVGLRPHRASRYLPVVARGGQ